MKISNNRWHTTNCNNSIIVVQVHRRIINHIAFYLQMDQNKCRDSTKVLYLLVLA